MTLIYITALIPLERLRLLYETETPRRVGSVMLTTVVDGGQIKSSGGRTSTWFVDKDNAFVINPNPFLGLPRT